MRRRPWEAARQPYVVQEIRLTVSQVGGDRIQPRLVHPSLTGALAVQEAQRLTSPLLDSQI